VNVCPPIVIVPVRGDVAVCAAAEKPTVPGPLPEEPDVTVNQPELLLVAVHAQPAAVFTVAEPVPPAAATVWLDGESE
jgi:hypothetical protein